MEPRPCSPRAESPRDWLAAYPPDIPPNLVYPEGPVSGFMEAAARNFPERPACTLYGRATTYAQLADRARRFAHSLADLGARPGRRVGMLLPNIPEYLVGIRHYRLLTRAQERALASVDRRMFGAGLVGRAE